MYEKDKNHRITLRLNDAQFDFVRENADSLGVSPSEFLRMVVCSSMSATVKLKRIVTEYNSEDLGRENDKNNINDKL